MKEIPLGIAKKQEAHAGEKLLFHKLDAGGPQFIPGAVQIVRRECKLAQAGVANERGRSMRFREDKLQHYAFCRLDIDRFSGIEQRAKSQKFQISGGKHLGIEAGNRDRLQAGNHFSSPVNPGRHSRRSDSGLQVRPFAPAEAQIASPS